MVLHWVTSVMFPCLRFTKALSLSICLAGIESFEEKIGSFASAEVDSNPDSWLNAAFKKIGVNVEEIGDEGKEGNLKLEEGKGKEKEDGGEKLDLNGNRIGDGLENPILEDPASE